MAAHAVSPTTRTRAVAWPAVADAVTYWAGLAGIYVSYGFLWFYSAKEKLFDQDGHMPAGLAKGYSGHFIASFPGINTSWLLLGLLEAVAFVAVIASLLVGEFLPHRGKPILLAALGISMLTFAVMTFGQNVIGNFDGVASLFSYLGVTALSSTAVHPRSWSPPRSARSARRLMPDRRCASWSPAAAWRRSRPSSRCARWPAIAWRSSCSRRAPTSPTARTRSARRSAASPRPGSRSTART